MYMLTMLQCSSGPELESLQPVGLNLAASVKLRLTPQASLWVEPWDRAWAAAGDAVGFWECWWTTFLNGNGCETGAKLVPHRLG